jgi:type I restriction enzyme S subunit
MSARRYEAYPAYKDSGVEWLGEIPADWSVKRLKEIACVQLSNVDKKTVEGDKPTFLCNYVDVYYNERITANLDFMEATATAAQIHRFSLRVGDVLITKDSESWTDIAVPAVVAEKLPGVIAGYHLAHITPAEGCFGSFLARAFAAAGVREQFQVVANGITRFGLGKDAISSGLFALPPESEQRAIADFLDRETVRIDELVAKKERLIELLQEQRTALITRAVTKGLDPNVPMKNSGVEWLGEIPAHWEVARVKKTLRARITGPFGSSLTKDSYGGHLYRVYGQEQVIAGDFAVGDYYIPESKYQMMNRYAVVPGDVLLSCVGTFGRAVVVPEGIQPGIINPRLILLRPMRSTVVPEYLELFLKSELSYSQMDAITRGGTMDIINLSTISALVMPLPPKAEQAEILKKVQGTNSQIDALLTDVGKAIDLFKELRTALISAAVTGKIDVREEVA